MYGMRYLALSHKSFAILLEQAQGMSDDAHEARSEGEFGSHQLCSDSDSMICHNDGQDIRLAICDGREEEDG